MAWIRTVPPGEASGRLRRLYDQAIARAGKVFHIISLQSLRPAVLKVSTDLYLELMRSPRGRLTRPQCEMIATAVSRANGCVY